MTRVVAPGNAGAESYSQLLKRAASRPETLSLADKERLAPEDTRLIAAAYDREIAKADAQLHGLRVSERLTGRRQRELLVMARDGQLALSSLSDDEHRAIDATPGFMDKLWEAMG